MSGGMDPIAAMTGVGNILGQGVNLFQVLDNMYRFNQRNKEPMFADIMAYQNQRFNEQPYGPYSNPQDSFGGVFGSNANGQATQYGDWAAQQLMGMFQNNPANYAMNQLGNAASMQRPQNPSFASMYGSGGGYQPGSYASPYASNGATRNYTPQQYGGNQNYGYQQWGGYGQGQPQYQQSYNPWYNESAQSSPQMNYGQTTYTPQRQNPYSYQPLPGAQIQTQNPQTAFATTQSTGGQKSLSAPQQANTGATNSVMRDRPMDQNPALKKPQPAGYTSPTYQDVPEPTRVPTVRSGMTDSPIVTATRNRAAQGGNNQWNNAYQGLTGQQPAQTPGQYQYTGGQVYNRGNANTQGQSQSWGNWQPQAQWPTFSNGMPIPAPYYSGGGRTNSYNANISNLNMPTGMLQGIMDAFNNYLTGGGNQNQTPAQGQGQQGPQPVPGAINLYQNPNTGGAYYGGGILDTLSNIYGRNPGYGSGQTGMYNPNYGLGGGQYRLPQYATGTPYVPQTGPAILHKGEAVIPAQQNPVAQQVQPPRMAQMPTSMVPPTNPNTDQLRNNLVAQQLQNPQSMGPQVQQQLYKAQADETDKMLQDQTRQIREDAGARGMQQAGATDYLVNQARMNRANTLSAALGDIQAKAAVQNFNDRNSVANMALQQQLGVGSQGLQQQQLALQQELGRGGLGLQQELGRGELGLKGQAQQLAEQLGLGQLGIGQRAQSLSEELGRGELGLKGSAQTLAEQLGLGQLGLSQQELGLQTELGRGQLGVSQSAQTLAERMGLGELGLKGQAQALAEGLGYGQLGLQQQQFGLESELGRRAQALSEQTQMGQLGLEQQRFGLESELGRRGQTLSENLGYGGLGLQERGQTLAEQLGYGNLGISQADQAFRERMGMGEAQMQYQNMLQDQFNQDRAFQSQLAQSMFGIGQAGTAQQMGLLGEFANLIGQGEQWNQSKLNDLWSRGMQLYASPDIAPFSYANYPPDYTGGQSGGGGNAALWGALGQAAGSFIGGPIGGTIGGGIGSSSGR